MRASPPALARLAGLTAAVVLGAAALTAVIVKLACGDCFADADVGVRVAAPSLMAAGSDEPRSAMPPIVAHDSAQQRPMAQLEHALFVKGSLRGTEFPGWGVARGEPVKPNRALRDRFDYYLLALSEASLGELTALVKAHAERDLGAAAAADILAVWERYLALQQHSFRHVANPLDPASMQTALQEHQQVRQGILGVHWAQVFYGDDEKALADELQRAQSGVARPVNTERALFQPPPGTDAETLQRQRTERFGAEAAQRLRAIEDEEAKWAQRLARARADLDTLQHNAGYSAPQREDAIARYLDNAFPEPSERLRASGLLGL